MLIFVQCIVNFLFSKIAQKYNNEGKDPTPNSWYAFMSLSYLGAMLSSNHALQYVNYPTQVIGKSIKPIPVMILGVLFARKKYPPAKYLFVFMIVAGIALFMYNDKKNNSDTGFVLGPGEILLIISLSLDGMTGAIQDRIKTDYKTKKYGMMLNLNAWSVIYLIFALVIENRIVEFIQFTVRHPAVITEMLVFSLCSAVGQNYIFKTVTTFGPLTCSIITTTRKFFTILMSIIIFQHPMVMRQYLGTLLVFMGIALDAAYGREKKPNIHEK